MGKLSLSLVENKVVLLDNEKEEDDSLQEYSTSNEFCGCFRTLAKTWLNISESMKFLIKNIIKRMEDMAFKGNEGFIAGRKNALLDPIRSKNKKTFCWMLLKLQL